MRINNVDVDRVKQTVATVQADPGQAKRTNRVEVSWQFAEGQVQMAGTAMVEGKPVTLEADSPVFLGGGGLRPGPIPYCLFGFATCYAGTFAAVAAEQGVRLRRLKVTAETTVDFTRALGLGDTPPSAGMRFIVEAEAADGRETLERLKTAAYERCPGVYCITHAVPLTVTLA
ncbi:MAG: OsmC family protein [Candidatus Rokubacteria bacterium]|nr:OsmC family protein [Candidatus Rokubacteria bacterium]